MEFPNLSKAAHVFPVLEREAAHRCNDMVVVMIVILLGELSGLVLCHIHVPKGDCSIAGLLPHPSFLGGWPIILPCLLHRHNHYTISLNQL